MFLYDFRGEFDILLSPLDIFEIILWIIVCIVFAYIGYKFFRESKEIKMSIFAGLFFILTIGARIIRLIAKFIVGHEYGDYQFEGIQLFLSFFYLMFTYLSLLFYYIYLERDFLKKTHHFFSIMVIINIIVTILNYLIPEMFFLLVITFLIAILGVPSCYFYIACKSSGNKRKHALMMMAGLLLVIFGITLDAPAPSSLYVNISFMPEFAQFGAPSLQILGAVLYRYTLVQEREG